MLKTIKSIFFAFKFQFFLRSSVFQGFCQRSRALRCCEVRNFIFSAKIKFLAKSKREFTTKFAIAQNVCYVLVFYTNLVTQTLPVFFPVRFSSSFFQFPFSDFAFLFQYFLRKISTQTFSNFVFSNFAFSI